jgi:hypothetical protein
MTDHPPAQLEGTKKEAIKKKQEEKTPSTTRRKKSAVMSLGEQLMKLPSMNERVSSTDARSLVSAGRKSIGVGVGSKNRRGIRKSELLEIKSLGDYADQKGRARRKASRASHRKNDTTLRVLERAESLRNLPVAGFVQEETNNDTDILKRRTTRKIQATGVLSLESSDKLLHSSGGEEFMAGSEKEEVEDEDAGTKSDSSSDIYVESDVNANISCIDDSEEIFKLSGDEAEITRKAQERRLQQLEKDYGVSSSDHTSPRYQTPEQDAVTSEGKARDMRIQALEEKYNARELVLGGDADRTRRKLQRPERRLTSERSKRKLVKSNGEVDKKAQNKAEREMEVARKREELETHRKKAMSRKEARRTEKARRLESIEKNIL